MSDRGLTRGVVGRTCTPPGSRGEHDAVIERLQTEYGRLQKRLDAMYVDKLDGPIDTTAYERMAESVKTEIWLPFVDTYRTQNIQAATQEYLAARDELFKYATVREVEVAF